MGKVKVVIIGQESAKEPGSIFLAQRGQEVKT